MHSTFNASTRHAHGHTDFIAPVFGRLGGFTRTLDQAGDYCMAAAFADKGNLYFNMSTSPGQSSAESRDDALGKQLWEYTEGLIAEKTAGGATTPAQ